MSISSYYELASFFIPFYHYPSLSNTFCYFIYFSFAFENQRTVPSLLRQIVLACYGISRSDDDDFQAFSYNFNFFKSYFSLFLCYLRYRLLYIFSASLFFFRYSSSYSISRPYILNADKNSSASSPFFNPNAFRIPFETRLLFLSSYYMTICLSYASCSLSESDWIRFLCLLYDQSEDEERLSLNWISLSLM